MDHECLYHRLHNRTDGDGNPGRPFWPKARFLCRDLTIWNYISALRQGFSFMKLGSSVDQASWLTMLPGCLLAGVGLGLTNTPVTNTTTASVPSARAGMASGIDMSARLISLAINIALMGFVLVNGIVAYLEGAIHESVHQSRMRSLAERIAAGDAASLDHAFPDLHVASDGIIHGALVNGFGLVMLYGCIGVWVLAVTSFVTFRGRKPTRSRDVNQPDCLLCH
jgi:hypothetical protein